MGAGCVGLATSPSLIGSPLYLRRIWTFCPCGRTGGAGWGATLFGSGIFAGLGMSCALADRVNNSTAAPKAGQATANESLIANSLMVVAWFRRIVLNLRRTFALHKFK